MAGSAPRQEVQAKAAQELRSTEAHQPFFSFLAAVLPAEGNPPALDAPQPIIGQGNAMGVAAEVTDDLLWPGKWPLGAEITQGFW